MALDPPLLEGNSPQCRAMFELSSAYKSTPFDSSIPTRQPSSQHTSHTTLNRVSPSSVKVNIGQSQHSVDLTRRVGLPTRRVHASLIPHKTPAPLVESSKNSTGSPSIITSGPSSSDSPSSFLNSSSSSPT